MISAAPMAVVVRGTSAKNRKPHSGDQMMPVYSKVATRLAGASR